MRDFRKLGLIVLFLIVALVGNKDPEAVKSSFAMMIAIVIFLAQKLD